MGLLLLPGNPILLQMRKVRLRVKYLPWKSQKLLMVELWMDLSFEPDYFFLFFKNYILARTAVKPILAALVIQFD